MKKYWRSRLAKKEERRNIRQTILYVTLSLLLVLGVIFLGIPILIKIAVFFGNLKGSYTPVESQDMLPPSPPILQSLFEATSSAEINLHGLAEPGSSVEIFISGLPNQKIVVENDGQFSITNLKLTIGLNEISAKATDRAGNTSLSSEKLAIIYDVTPPKLTISQPADNSHFTNNQKTTPIIGETEEDTQVSINDHLVIVNSEGKFNYSLPLVAGENKVRLVATDQAGNQTRQELTLWQE